MNKPLVLAVALLTAAPAVAQTDGGTEFTAGEQRVAQATMKDGEGNTLGTVALVETPNGLLIQPELEGLPPGMHGFHVHENGACEPPTFESAGGHYNPTGAMHGFLNQDGAHAGDLPNVYVGEDGMLQGDALTSRLTLEEGAETSLLKEGGTAIVIHATLDDYETDPAGDAGDRIACGVIDVQ